mmetsp:Transcript_65630/g.182563  ORF Transcript_65630/g.182563 Transcript_65630/m.182563 type:complete len:89 (+) Transcript_65630:541-807(+)
MMSFSIRLCAAPILQVKVLALRLSGAAVRMSLSWGTSNFFWFRQMAAVQGHLQKTRTRIQRQVDHQSHTCSFCASPRSRGARGLDVRF